MVYAVEWDNIVVCEPAPRLYFFQMPAHLHDGDLLHDDVGVGPLGAIHHPKRTFRQRSANLNDLIMSGRWCEEAMVAARVRMRPSPSWNSGCCVERKFQCEIELWLCFGSPQGCPWGSMMAT
jgi:hypothetical protein